MARKNGLVEELPELPVRKAPTAVKSVAVVVRRGRTVLVTPVPAGAPRWAGLWTFPYVERRPGESARAGALRALRGTGIAATIGAELMVVVHTITRFRITLEVLEATANDKRAPKHGEFRTLAGLRELAMPAPHRKLAGRLDRRLASSELREEGPERRP